LRLPSSPVTWASRHVAAHQLAHVDAAGRLELAQADAGGLRRLRRVLLDRADHFLRLLHDLLVRRGARLLEVLLQHVAALDGLRVALDRLDAHVAPLPLDEGLEPVVGILDRLFGRGLERGRLIGSMASPLRWESLCNCDVRGLIPLSKKRH